MADIITYPENGITYDADDAAGYLATRLSGVYSAEEDFAVTPNGDLTVTVSAGQAWVRPARFKGRSIIMEQPTTVVLTEADPVRSRIDRIVLRYDAAAKKTRLQVLDGTPDSANPTAPEITRTALIYDLSLCTVTRPAGSTAITAAHITDTRADETVCGVMRDGVTGIPVAQLIQRLQADIEAMEKGSFYTRAEVDALLKAMQTTLKKQISAASAITASGKGYIRFSDGTQICWNTAKLTNRNTYYVFAFAVPFIDTTYAVAGMKTAEISDTSDNGFYFNKKTTDRVELKSACNSYNENPYSTLIVIGRWK